MTILRQRDQIKSRYPGAVLLFRVGDFVEAYEDDADTLCGITGMSVRSRKMDGQQVRCCGFPYAVMHQTVDELTGAGHKAVYCVRSGDLSRPDQTLLLLDGIEA